MSKTIKTVISIIAVFVISFILVFCYLTRDDIKSEKGSVIIVQVYDTYYITDYVHVNNGKIEFVSSDGIKYVMDMSGTTIKQMKASDFYEQEN